MSSDVTSSISMVPNISNVKESVKSLRFGKSPRFEKNEKPTDDVPYYLGHSDFVYDYLNCPDTLGKSKRFKRLIKSDFPGPGEYRFPSFTDKFRIIKEKNEMKASLENSKNGGMNNTEEQGFYMKKFSLIPKNNSGKTTNLPSNEISVNVSFDKKK